MTTLGIDTSTDLIGVAFHDGEDFVSVMEFEDVQDAVQWTARRIKETPPVAVFMSFYSEEFIDLFIDTETTMYFEYIGEPDPSKVTERAKHLALTQQSLTTNPINK